MAHTTTLADLPPDSTALVFAANEAYALPLAVSLHSAVRRMSRPVPVVIADSGLSANTRRVLDRIADSAGAPSLRYIDQGELDLERNLSRHSASALTRLQVPRLLVDEYETLVYLDSDVLVTDDLSRMPAPQEHTICAAPDAGGPAFRFKEHLGGFEVEPDTPYFNTGVLVLKTREWVASDIERRANGFLETQGARLCYPDQDALNLVFNGEWTPLHARWNVQLDAIWSRSSTLDPEALEGARDPAVLHYISQRKPWHCARPRRERVRWLAEALRVGAGSPGFGLRKAGWLANQYATSTLRRVRPGSTK